MLLPLVDDLLSINHLTVQDIKLRTKLLVLRFITFLLNRVQYLIVDLTPIRPLYEQPHEALIGLKLNIPPLEFHLLNILNKSQQIFRVFINILFIQLSMRNFIQVFHEGIDTPIIKCRIKVVQS